MALSDRTNIFDKHEDAKKRIKELEEAIRKHRSAKGHESCWLNDQELYSTLGEKMPNRELPPKQEFLAACERYYSDQNKQ